MVREVSSDAKLEKNKTETGEPWLILYEVDVGEVERLFLVNNEEDVVFNGRTYRKFPIAFSELEENLRGDLPVLDIVVSNATREVQAFLEHANGLLDREVRIYFISGSLLDDPAAAISQSFRITATTADAERVTFRLSQLPLLDINLPHQRFSRTRCRFQFRGEECGWGFPSLPSGVEDSTTCSKLYDGPNGCAAHGQLYTDAGEVSQWPDRWGGFRSIPRRRV